MEIYLSPKNYKELECLISCEKLIRSAVIGTFSLGKKQYVITGSSSGYSGRIYHGILAVDQCSYIGRLKPLDYLAHFNEVNSGRRDRSYNGMLCSYSGRMLVLTGSQIEFKVTQLGVQHSLF